MELLLRQSGLASLCMDANRNIFVPTGSTTRWQQVMTIRSWACYSTKNVSLLEKESWRPCVLPDTWHRMQSPDVWFVLLFSTCYTQDSEIWPWQNPEKIVTVRQDGYLFGKAYRTAATPRDAEIGFKNISICTFGPMSNCDQAGRSRLTADWHSSMKNAYYTVQAVDPMRSLLQMPNKAQVMKLNKNLQVVPQKQYQLKHGRG
jgi:hypothetical protein